LAAVVGAGIGVVCSYQSVSVASGMGVIWVGLALCAAAVLVAFVVPDVRGWVKIAVVVALVIAAYNVGCGGRGVARVRGRSSR
jgi:hypothetical protein